MLLVCGLLVESNAQEGFPVNGVDDTRAETYAFTNATIFVDHSRKIENATLVIRDGVVVGIGTNISLPKNAIVRDMTGKTIYPSFVEPYSDYGMPEVKRESFNWMAPPQMESRKKGPFAWNESVKAEINASEVFNPDTKKAEALRKAGFGAVVSHHPDGIVRGSAALVALSSAPAQHAVVKPKVGANFSFDRGSSRQDYPNSIMGSVALIRQTHYDAVWYKSPQNQKQVNLSLAAYNELMNYPAVIEATDNLRTLLAAKVGNELGIRYIIKGAGDEYQSLDEIKKNGNPLLIPVNFPEGFDVDDPYDALNVTLAQLKHWELAPKNAAFLTQAGVTFAFTGHGLKNADDYLKNIRKAISYGLTEGDALKAMITTPASLLKVSDKVGSLDNGKLANFIIASGNIFDEKTKLYENWVAGEKFTLVDMNVADFGGKYDLKIGNDSYKLEITGDPGSHTAKVKVNDTTSLDTKMKIEGLNLTLTISPKKDGDIRLAGFFNGKNAKGQGQLSNGTWVQWGATFTAANEATGDKRGGAQKQEPQLGDIIYPFVGYGSKEKLKPETILIRNATVWTSDEAGVLQNTDVLISNGKIAAVGKGLSDVGARVIDGTGKHLSPGIIDEHSHAALSGVNEGSQANTGEVRMEDAIDSEDINIYRQLSGGVVAAQLLHGSANPVGGQSAIVKFRWGQSPEGMKIQGADGFIKFALGENVKQSSRTAATAMRFPVTRMGVEQVFVDAFNRAQAYDKAWKDWNALPLKTKATTPAPRRDLELETMAEILNKKRFISCHSYVQSEINMLMKVAEKFNFTVNTFTHILEGYKVADIMAEHGAGGSSFADWWAYKMEVREAIPYNAALLQMAGVVTAINSDDAEMARRLNQEAAKAVKYGGVSEEEALKMVTINPAKLLHLDKRMGSIKVGKDADVVLWSDNPLSIYAKAEKTIIDGVVYYDLEKDIKMREEINAERARIIAKMRDSKAQGNPARRPPMQWKHHWDCEDVVDYLEEEHLHVHDH